MGNRKLLFSHRISNEDPDFSSKIMKDGLWNATAVKKIIYLNSDERNTFYNELDNKIYDEIKANIDDKYAKYLLKYEVTVKLLFFLLSPIARLIRGIKKYTKYYLLS